MRKRLERLRFCASRCGSTSLAYNLLCNYMPCSTRNNPRHTTNNTPQLSSPPEPVSASESQPVIHSSPATPVQSPTPTHLPTQETVDVSASQTSTGLSLSNKALETAPGARWLAWQDRYLVAEVYRIRPWEKSTCREILKAWDEVAKGMREASLRSSYGIELVRSGEAYRARLQRLLQFHKMCFLVVFHLPYHSTGIVTGGRG